MSLIHSPNIDLSDVVLYLDAFNAKSFNGLTTWKCLTSGLVTTMYGTVPTGTDGGMSFDFATVSGASSNVASLGFTFPSNPIPTLGSFTFSCWIKSPPATVSQQGLFSNDGSGIGYRFGVGQNGIYALCGPSYAEGQVSFASFNNNAWHNVTAVFDRQAIQGGIPKIYGYLDGVVQGSITLPAVQTTSTSNSPGLVRSTCCGLYTGKLAIFAAWKKGLTAAEVASHYNSLKGRFGR